MRMRLSLIVAALSLVMTVVVSKTSHAVANDATLSAAELKDQMKAKLAQIRDIDIEYQIGYQHPDGSEIPEMYVYHRLILKSPDRGLFVLAHNGALVPWKDDPFMVVTRLSRSGIVRERPMSRLYFFAKLKPDEVIASINTGHYVRSTGLWPLEYSIENDGFLTLPQVVESDEFSVVRPKLHEISGVRCHVLENKEKTESLWIDTGRTVIMRREIFSDKKVTGDERRPVARFDFSDHRDVRDDIWLPHRVLTLRFDAFAADPAARDKIITQTDLVVTSISLDEIDEKAFSFVIPPGAATRTNTNQVHQIRADGVELLDEISEWTRKYVFADQRSTAEEQPQWKAQVILLALAAVVLVLAAEWLARRRTREGGRSEAPVP